MMSVRVELRKSDIQGTGMFAAQDIHKDQVLWMFTPGLDRIISEYAVTHAEPLMRDFIMKRGYFNSGKRQWVLCVDETQFWNFPRRGEEANTIMGNEIDGEKIVIAARDIATGEELTIPPESDADYSRKMEGR